MHVIDELQKYSSSDMVDNIYQEPLKAKNLDVYLTTIKNRKPKAILIGTSPVLYGGRKTGIPFTDEYYISNEKIFLLQQKDERGYEILTTGDEKLGKDRVSEIIWTGLEKEIEDILLWNIFPFYPHVRGMYSCRRPITAEEGESGYHFLQLILEEIPSIHVILVAGDQASEVIRNHEELKEKYQIFHVGHPNLGARDEFIARVKKQWNLSKIF